MQPNQTVNEINFIIVELISLGKAPSVFWLTESLSQAMYGWWAAIKTTSCSTGNL